MHRMGFNRYIRGNVPFRNQLSSPLIPPHQKVRRVVSTLASLGIKAPALNHFEDHIDDLDKLFDHQKRSASHAYKIALCLPPGMMMPEERSVLHCAARLHDIGKSVCDLPTLFSSKRLNDTERASLRPHAEESYRILSEQRTPFYNLLLREANKNEGLSLPLFDPKDKEIPVKIALAAKHHHEHFDGSGYPEGLKGTNIPLVSRIIAVADVYDALRSQRSYKDGMERDAVLAQMSDDSGKYFDPLVFGALLGIEMTAQPHRPAHTVQRPATFPVTAYTQ